jgi:SAM-dependent methyltransferase
VRRGARRFLARRQRPPGPHGTGLAGADAAFDTISCTDDATLVTGWLLSRDYPIDSVRVSVNGRMIGEAEVSLRPDVGRHFPAIAHAARSGFSVTGPPVAAAGPLHVALIGGRYGRDLVCHEHDRPDAAAPARPVPPPHLIARIAGTPDAAEFRDYGFAIAAQVLRAARAHAPGCARPRVLDWGCGPGRATQFMPALWPEATIVGCDIDAAAIGWATRHIPGAEFRLTGPYPPLPFAAGTFEVVVAASVMTHLTASVQRRWLREIRRVLAPGGVLVASVLGPYAAARTPGVAAGGLEARGIIDACMDPALDGIAPAGYYRDTLQTVEHTYACWSRGFRIVSYREAALVSFQDIVVLRRERGLADGLRPHSAGG